MTSAPIALSRALTAHNVPKLSDQAALLGISVSTWWKYRTGRSPQCSRLHEWLERLAKEGVRLQATDDPETEWVVTKVDEGGE